MTIDDFVAEAGEFTGALIYHGAQLRDFETYAGFGRIASRAQLFARPTTDYTPFVSDRFDESHGIDTSYFANLFDQALPAVGGRSIPNVYGPITLVFKLSALLNDGANEIIVRKKGAFTRDDEGRRPLDPEEIGELYGASYNQKGDGEIEIRGGSLRIADAAYIIASPMTVHGTSLNAAVEQALSWALPRAARRPKVYERKFREDGLRIYNSLVNWSLKAPEHGGDALSLPSDLKKWYGALKMGLKEPNLQRFAEYLSHGTLSKLLGERGHLVAAFAFEEDVDTYYGIGFDSFEEATQLSDDEVSARDERIGELTSTANRLLKVFGGSDEDDFVLDWDPEGDTEVRLPSDNFSEAWQEHVAALDQLNDWIVATRERILRDYSAVCSSSDTAHDSELAKDLRFWASNYVELQVPGDLGDRDLLNVRWQDVLRYPESTLGTFEI